MRSQSGRLQVPWLTAYGARLTPLLAALLLSACAAPIRPPGEDISRPVEAPAEAVPAAGRAYTVDREASEFRILVFTDGPLARFGHPHVVGGNAVSGTVWLAEDFHDSSLELFIDVPAMRVDDPVWRGAEGFDPDLDGEAAATRDNMLSSDVLHAARHAQITIRSTAVNGPVWQPDVSIEITLRGVTRSMTVPVALAVDGAMLTAAGRFRLRPSEFGIEPFSAMGGNLLVADQVVVRFRIKAGIRI